MIMKEINWVVWNTVSNKRSYLISSYSKKFLYIWKDSYFKYRSVNFKFLHTLIRQLLNMSVPEILWNNLYKSFLIILLLLYQRKITWLYNSYMNTLKPIYIIFKYIFIIGIHWIKKCSIFFFRSKFDIVFTRLRVHCFSFIHW